MKIEPLSIDEIKAEVAKIDWRFALEPGAHSYRQARRWMTWAHAEARARRLTHAWKRHDMAKVLKNGGIEVGFFKCPNCKLKTDADWLAEVLREIGMNND